MVIDEVPQAQVAVLCINLVSAMIGDTHHIFQKYERQKKSTY